MATRGGSAWAVLSVVLLTVLLFSWKIGLFEVEDAETALRLDDFVIVAAGLFYLTAYAPQLARRIPRSTVWLLFLVAWSIVSGIVNWGAYQSIPLMTSLLYSLRHLEYWLIFLIGLGAPKTRTLNTVLTLYVVYALGLVLLQFLGVLEGASRFNVQDRAVANTGGPWELAAVSAFLALWFIDQRRYLWVGLSLLLMILSASRITTVATLLVLSWYYVISSERYHRLALFVAGSCAVALFFILGHQLYVMERVAAVFSPASISELIGTISDLPTLQTRGDFEFFDLTLIKANLSNFSSDPSMFARGLRWALAFRLFEEAPLWQWLVGFGPSYFGHGLDGWYLRVLAETGLIGWSLFLFFLRALWRETVHTRYLRAYLAVLILTAFFIDIFGTYKAMLLLWFFLAVERKLKERRLISKPHHDTPAYISGVHVRDIT